MRKLIVLFCFIIIAASASGQKKIKWTEMKGPIFANIETDVVLPENCKLSSGKVEASYDSGESWRLVGTKCTNDSKLIIYSPNDSEKIKLINIIEYNNYIVHYPDICKNNICVLKILNYPFEISEDEAKEPYFSC